MPKIKIVPSILSADQERLQDEIDEIEGYSEKFKEGGQDYNNDYS